MKTPIFDFVKMYQEGTPIRAHMPGHKGVGMLGVESFDITEIDGADVLYHEDGIIKESQENASSLFGSYKTLYSTEGATLCIRAMLAAASLYAREQGKNPVIAACRNAHKSFITACALLGIDPIWISDQSGSLLSCKLNEEDLRAFFSAQEVLPTALYVTSPDYLGNMMDIRSIAKVCHEFGVLLLVDNAHGAYLHFLPDPAHPLDLGADLVCDSAHKTLPVLTGGAYLHVGKSAPENLAEVAPQAMALFASTSPSYLILQSLDLCNAYLADGYGKKLYEFSAKIVDFKKELKSTGYQVVGDEPLKITILTKFYGYRGTDFAELLKENQIFVEFSDPDYVVLMLTPELDSMTMEKILSVFKSIKFRDPILEFPPKILHPIKCITPREALLSPFETLPLEACKDRILAQAGITCPPAIPIAICGEKITEEHLKAFRYYSVEKISVKK